MEEISVLFIRVVVGVPCRQLPHAPENPTAVLSTSEKRAIDLAWAKPFDGNSPLIRYILEVSENSKSHLARFSQTLIHAAHPSLTPSVTFVLVYMHTVGIAAAAQRCILDFFVGFFFFFCRYESFFFSQTDEARSNKVEKELKGQMDNKANWECPSFKVGCRNFSIE